MEKRKICLPKDINVTLKCVVAGDGAVGKTCMLYSYAKGKFPKIYEPTVFDNFSTNVSIGNDCTCQLLLFDTAGQEDYETLRKIAYVDTDIILLCFNVTDTVSFKNIEIKWAPEIRQVNKSATIILVGLKIDLRDKNQNTFITKQEGIDLANKLKLPKYVECSALTRDGLKNVFDEAVKTILYNKYSKPLSKKAKCSII